LLDTSGGRGGYHLWIVFRDAIPMRDARRLILWLVDGWESFGVRRRPDLFPGNSVNGKKGFSGWLRLPGRHHKRPEWARVWSPRRKEWLAGNEAIDSLLRLTGKPVNVAQVTKGWPGQGAPPTAGLKERTRLTQKGSQAKQHAAGRRHGREQREIPLVAPRAQYVPGQEPIDLFIAQLRAMNLEVVKSNDSYIAQCPVHDDSTPSLSIGCGRDGQLLLYCHSCGGDHETFRAIMTAVGLEERDAFPAVNPIIRAHTTERRTMSCGRKRDYRNTPTTEESEKWERQARRFEAALNLSPNKRRLLAETLGVAVESLVALGVGWREDREKPDGEWVGTGRWAWTFPERDGQERVVGIMRRYEDPNLPKKAISGGRRGLIVANCWRDLAGPIIVTEGASDTAAVLSEGRCAIGRPQAASLHVVNYLVELLEDEERDIIVAADEDPSGTGRAGAEDLARSLTSALGRVIRVLPPLPAGFKDLRQLLTSAANAGRAER
jgi:hypothetical protein